MLVIVNKYNLVNQTDCPIVIDNLINLNPYSSVTVDEIIYSELIKLDYFNNLIKNGMLSSFKYETKNLIFDNTTIKDINTTNNIKTRKRKSTKSKQNCENINVKDNVD